MNQQQSSGIGCLSLLGLIFITLKLMGYITWSWIWVLSPFWGPLLLFVLIGVFGALAVAWAKSR